jgi:hypothetical protein
MTTLSSGYAQKNRHEAKKMRGGKDQWREKWQQAGCVESNLPLGQQRFELMVITR